MRGVLWIWGKFVNLQSKSITMAISNYKKTIGPGMLILFTLFLINVIFVRIPITHDSVWFNVREWWFPLSLFLQFTVVLFVAYNPNSQSSIISKIGAVLYSLLMLIYISDRICFYINGSNIVYYEGVTIYICLFLLYAPGVLLFVWGLCKLWLPIKIVTSILVAVHLIGNVILTKLVLMYKDMADLSYEQSEKIEPLQNAVDILSNIHAIIIIALVILTIAWLSMKQKVPSVQTNNIDII